MKIEVLGNEKTVVAFSLAGIGGRVVTSREEALKIVKNSKEVGVFLVMDEYYPYGYDEDFPILIRIPGRK
ncbi:MAG: V-type ATP synthase subunit F [Thermoproteota archaeon]|jgi:vacuolar-type H+-ATPase subunit F/Vma7